MTLTEITERGINPALALLPARMDSYEARVMLLTIGQQESRFQYRRQMVGSPPQPTGPAMGFWQFERGGGVKGVMTHPAVASLARMLCEARGVPFEADAIWRAIENDDVLAAGLARLLLFTDPKPLPDVKAVDSAWNYYVRTWRPGKPHAQTWPSYHLASRRFLGLAS
ncbi:MAG: hypothetical protein JSR41_24645 [Proteobacteria bacterium]|nr:hypothetical protein [Pseudomonadota bacterium]